MFGRQSKLIKYENKQKNVTHDQGKENGQQQKQNNSE